LTLSNTPLPHASLTNAPRHRWVRSSPTNSIIKYNCVARLTGEPHLLSINIIIHLHIVTRQKNQIFRDLTSLAGLRIKISDLYIRDFKATIHIAKQCNAPTCHKTPRAKGDLGEM
jgi:hypothetical protein